MCTETGGGAPLVRILDVTTYLDFQVTSILCMTICFPGLLRGWRYALT